MALSLGAVSALTSRIAKKLHHFVTNIASTNATVATGDVIITFDASDNYEPKYTTLTELLAGAATNAPVTVTDATTYTVLAANSRKTHIIPDLTETCTLTLPAPTTAGLEYVFIGKAVAADAQNWVFVSPGSVAILGGAGFADNDAGAGADEIHAGIYGNGTSNDTLTVVTPAAGTRVHFVSDGTNWIVNTLVISATIPTIADT